MNVNKLAGMLGDATYGFLALNLLWGLFCAILVWRRLSEVRFRNEEEVNKFVEEINEPLNAGDFDGAHRTLRARSTRSPPARSHRTNQPQSRARGSAAGRI